MGDKTYRERGILMKKESRPPFRPDQKHLLHRPVIPEP